MRGLLNLVSAAVSFSISIYMLAQIQGEVTLNSETTEALILMMHALSDVNQGRVGLKRVRRQVFTKIMT